MPDSLPGSLPLPALAARAQLGDRDSLEELLRRLQQPLSDHIGGMMRDDDAAADVLQDTLLIVCRRLGTLRETQWVRAWAYRIATREAIRALRKARRALGDLANDTLSHTAATGTTQPDEELLRELPQRLASLPPRAQVVLRLHYLESLTHQEIAEALEIPIGTVKSRLAYGLQRLRETWTP